MSDVRKHEFACVNLLLHFEHLVDSQSSRLAGFKPNFSSMNTESCSQWFLTNLSKVERSVEFHRPLHYIWKVAENEQNTISC